MRAGLSSHGAETGKGATLSLPKHGCSNRTRFGKLLSVFVPRRANDNKSVRDRKTGDRKMT